jgi:hypothetical protein
MSAASQRNPTGSSSALQVPGTPSTPTNSHVEFNTPQPAPLHIHRTISHALRAAREREESETLLGDVEGLGAVADRSGCIAPPGSAMWGGRANPWGHLPVYKNMHRIRRLVMASIDDPYSIDQLMSPRMNVALVRPLTDRLYDPDDISMVYCLLVNRARFMRDQNFQNHHQTVNLSRAMLCELIAVRMLRKFNEDHPTRSGLLMLANILVSGFEPFQNCPEDVLKDNQELLHRRMSRGPPAWDKTTNALEVAIISESKVFLASSACQRVVESLYRGRIVYTPNSLLDIIPDHYKRKVISLYDPKRAPMLNHYRLIVPRTRALLEFGHFVLLMFLYVMTMVRRDGSRVTGWEVCFLFYSAGWMLDELASMLEHGWLVHTQNLWSFLDISLVVIYTIYFAVRFHGWTIDNDEFGIQALDVLACAAPIMLPRLAFNMMPENLLFISLRAMMKDFIVLTAVAGWCFAGFLFAMAWLSRWRSHVDEPITLVTISKWMLWIWFGLDGTGVERSVDFHMILGPLLMISFAFIGNTLFLTILVSMLTNTFSKIAANATQEIQFRRAVLTFEGVKSDAIFAYRPPFNILAVLVLVPLRFLTSERWFHKIHVAAARTLNAPILFAISFYERRYLWQSPRRGSHGGALKTRSARQNMWSSLIGVAGFSAHRDLNEVFELDPPQLMVDEIEEEDVIDDEFLEAAYLGAVGGGTGSSARQRSRSPRAVMEERRRRMSSVVPVGF